MFLLSKPDRPAIDAFMATAANDKLSYPDVGATLSDPPDGYTVDHNRIMIGRGDEDWERAKGSVRSWKMFDFPWVELCWPDTPIETGRDVAILVSHLGFCSLNAARIVYTIDEPERFGFAYGTLTNHAESGEERFSVEMDKATGEVWFDLYAFSRPNHLLAKFAYPIGRMFQKRFASDSKSAMKRSAQH
jgi:uncharacterized protein (UPF0548 family)